MNYNITSNWQIKFGLGYDQTPTRKDYRDVRSPDEDHYTASIGLHSQLSTRLGFDIGYSHTFMPVSQLNGRLYYTLSRVSSCYRLAWAISGIYRYPRYTAFGYIIKALF